MTATATPVAATAEQEQHQNNDQDQFHEDFSADGFGLFASPPRQRGPGRIVPAERAVHNLSRRAVSNSLGLGPCENALDG
jgi:hypothetical protein